MTKKNTLPHLKRMLAGSVALIGIFSAQSAYSQSADAEIAKATSGDIIVTATKRNERLQDVPVSIVAVGAEQLNRTGTVSTTALTQLAPALNYAQSGQPKTSNFVLRGIGTFGVTNALEPSVGVAIDGVPIGRISGGISDLVDVDHVEVLKGPQGTLFGKNATAGLISIVTRKPELGKNSFAGNVSYGSFDEFNIDGTVNLALGDSGAIRLAAWRYGHKGFIRGATDGRLYNDKNSYGARLSVSVEPTDTLKLTMIGQYDGRDENGTVVTYLQFSPLSSPLIVARTAALGIVPGLGNRVADFGPTPFLKGDNMAITGLIDAELGGGYTLSSITSYRDVQVNSSFDSYATSTPNYQLSRLENPEHYDTFSHEVRLASPADKRLSFVAGLFYYDINIKDVLFQQTNILLPPLLAVSILNPIKVGLTDYAAFGEARLKVFGGLQLIGGIRQSHDRLTGKFDRYYIPGAPRSAFVTPTLSPLSTTGGPRKYDFTSYRLGAQWDVAQDIMLYATLSRGYKAPGFNYTPTLTAGALLTNGVPNGANVDAETARSLDIGFKTQFFDRRLTVNATAFFSTFKNFQTTARLSAVPTTIFGIQNAKELKSSGVDFEVSARPIQGLSLGVVGSYTHARFTDYVNAPCYSTLQTAAEGCVGGIQNVNGLSLSQSPKWAVNASTGYQTTIGESWMGSMTIDYTYRSRTTFDNNRDPVLIQPAYGIFNAQVGFGPADEKWKISVYARNIFDKFYLNRMRQFVGNYQQIEAYEANRRVGVSLSVRM